MLLFMLYAPGAVILNRVDIASVRRHVFSGTDEWVFTAVLISFLLTGGVGLLLAEMGMFRPWLIFAILLLFCLAINVIRGDRSRSLTTVVRMLVPPPPAPQRAEERRFARLQTAALVAILVVAAALFSRPAEMLRGALDSGVYVNAGVSLGRSGTIFQRDMLMRYLDTDKGETNELMQGLSRDRYTLANLRMAGFYVLDKQAALVMPQHYSLLPVWIGLLYGLFGIWGGLYANPLLALLGVAAVYFFARRAFSQGSALAALALLVLCPITIWFARYPVSEVIMGVLVFSACLGFLRMVQLTRDGQAKSLPPPHEDSLPVESDGRAVWAALWGAIAGVSLGEMALARPDFIFYLAPLPAYLIYWRLTRRWQRAHTWLLGSLLVMLGVYLVHLSFYGFAYTLDVYHNVIQNVRRSWGPLLLALYAGTLALVVLDRLHHRISPLWLRVESLVARYRWLWAGALMLLVGGYMAYHYLVGPWLPNPRFTDAGEVLPQLVSTSWESYIGAPVDLGSRYNLLRIGWYLSPLAMLLAIPGLLRWIWTRLSVATGLFFAMLLILSFVFVQETYTDAHYIYTMRRYVPIILPALLLAVLWACQWLWSRLRPRIVGAALAGVIVLGLGVFYIYTDRAIIPHVEERGAVAQLDDLVSRFPNPAKTVVLFSDGRDEPYLISTPLQFIYGVESFVLVREYPNLRSDIVQQVIKRWQSEGWDVYVMMGVNGGKAHFADLSLREVGSWDYDVAEFEQLYYQKPTNVSRAYLPWGIYKVEPAAAQPPTLPFLLDIGKMDYPWLVAGFNKQETSDGGASYWRWTGSHAILRVPVPATPDATAYQGTRITLSMRPETPVEGSPILRTEPLTITVALDDTQIGQVVLQPGSDFKEYSFVVPGGTPKKERDPATGLLHIFAPTWSGRPAGLGNDPRALGVQLDTVRLERAP
ncbi:MAG: hypothetical protein QOH93_2995 [Chloroflexia bacterium]|nr:hypothetical protein [Chloroflexia bacterium]